MTELNDLQNSIQNCLHCCEKIHHYETVLKTKKLSQTLKNYQQQSLAIEYALQALMCQLSAEKIQPTTRPYGLCEGEFTVPDDFDDPLPERDDAFIQQTETGTGNYTLERQQYLGNPDVSSLAADIIKQRGKQQQ